MEDNFKFSLTKEESMQFDQAVNALKTILEPKLISLLADDDNE